MRAFLPGQSRASFRNPGFGLEAMLCAAPNGVPVWQRAALRQGWQVCGCSAVCVILQDWQDRWNVAQIGDIPKPEIPDAKAACPRHTRHQSRHLPMMVRLLARISRNDLHWLNTLDAQELRALLQLIATAKTKRLNIATLLEAHNRHCTG